MKPLSTTSKLSWISAPDQDINQDLHPVILNPVMPEENGDFLELNYLQNNMLEQHLLQP